MGFLLEAEAQNRVINNMCINLQDIRDEIKVLDSIIKKINSTWISDAGEKFYIVSAIYLSQKGIAKEEAKLKTFAINARNCLKEMEEFRRYTCRYRAEEQRVVSPSIGKSVKSKIECDLSELQAAVSQLRACSRRLNRSVKSIAVNISQIDNQLAIVVYGGKGDLRRFQRSLMKEVEKINKIADALNGVVNNYRGAEEKVKKVSEGLKNGIPADVTLAVIQVGEEANNGIANINHISLDSEYADKVWEFFNEQTSYGYIKDVHKRFKALDGLFKLGTTLVRSSKESPLKDLLDTDLFKTLGVVEDIEEVAELVRKQDGEGLLEFAGKKGLGYIYKASGKAGFAASGYTTMTWNFIENAFSGTKYLNDPNPFIGTAKYAWHMTGWTLIESGTEMAYGYLDGAASIFGIDMDEVYGGKGLEGFYEQAEELTGMMMDQGVKGWCSGVQYAAGEIGKGTTKFVSGVKGFLNDIF